MNTDAESASDRVVTHRWAHWTIPLLVLLAGAGIALGLVKTKPEARRKPQHRQARLVQTLPVQFTSAVTRVTGMGTVIPSTEVELNPRVSGEVTSIAREWVPGGYLVRGQDLLEIDPTDYELAYRTAAGDLASTQSDVAVEMGRQAVAEQEFQMLGMVMSDDERDRVLRKPQLEKLKAGVATAEARLEQARLNLSRTSVKAPFNAVIRDRYVDVGAQVAPGTRLARIVGTDTFWIEVTIPVRDLTWIRIPRTADDDGARVHIYNDSAWGPETSRTGRVVRLLSELEPEGLMARLLIAVHDPLGLEPGSESPPLLLGEYVRVAIEGDELKQVVPLDRSRLRSGQTVWLLSEANTLEIREVGFQYETRDAVYVHQGLQEGEQIVITDLSSPVDGLPLRTQTSAVRPVDAEPKGEARP